MSGARRRLRRARRVLAAVVALCVAAASETSARDATTAQAREVYALVVHPSTRVSDLSLADVRRIFLGDQQFWPDGGRVVLFVHGPGTPGRSVALQHVYRMREPEFKRYWIAKTFRGDVAAGPKIVSGDELAKQLTASIPGAVALVRASEVDASVKVVTVDGRAPDAPQYPLATATR
jgi:phosphate transport system substrate-binding protein